MHRSHNKLYKLAGGGFTVCLCVYVFMNKVAGPKIYTSSVIVNYENATVDVTHGCRALVNNTSLFPNAETCPPPGERHNDPSYPQTKKPRILLYWTPFARSKNWRKPLGTERFKHCEYNNCRAEFDRKYVNIADFILFYGCRSVSSYPTVRHPWQIYGFHCGESPANTNVIRQYQHRMNLTSTNRLDSDVVVMHRFQPRPDAVPGPYLPRIPFRNKTKSVAWLVSNCHAKSLRRKYVDVLSKYIDIDIYGRCGPLACPRGKSSGTNPCFQKLEREYKFYLSFENTVCRDYVTEKLFNPLQHEIVPVVLGGANYSAVAPPHSYIDVRDFRSPEALAEYLLKLTVNEDRYLDYFRWKNSVEFVKVDMMCNFCELMTKGTFQRRAENWDIVKWWNYGTCDNDLVNRLLRN